MNPLRLLKEPDRCGICGLPLPETLGRRFHPCCSLEVFPHRRHRLTETVPLYAIARRVSATQFALIEKGDRLSWSALAGMGGAFLWLDVAEGGSNPAMVMVTAWAAVIFGGSLYGLLVVNRYIIRINHLASRGKLGTVQVNGSMDGRQVDQVDGSGGGCGTTGTDPGGSRGEPGPGEGNPRGPGGGD